VEQLEREEPGQNQQFYLTQYSLLDARSLAERVARKLKLANNRDFFKANGVSPKGESALSGGSALPSAAQLVDRERQVEDVLLDHVDISPVRGSALVDVSYTSASPQLSSQIADAWVQEFIQQSMDRRFASTSDARAYLESRLAGLRQRLEQSERELVNYAARQSIVPLGETREDDGRTRTTRTLASTDLDALNTALQEATAQRVAAEGQLRAAQQSRANPTSIDNTAINQLRAKRAEAQAEYASMLVKFDPQYPAAKALRENIDALNAAISTEENRVTQSYTTSFEAARAREAELHARVNKLLARLQRENRASIQFNIYQREVDTNRQLYEALLQRYKEIGVAGVGTNNIAIVDKAIVPDKPSSPHLIVNLLVALIAGLGVAVVVVFILENIDESLREPGQVSEALGVPLLGAIPIVESEESRVQAAADPKSVLSEAYMTVRTNLAFSTDHGVPRVLSLTSSSPAEGKSTSSYALAQVLGRTGKSVILLDADLRRPMMAEMLALDSRVGVSNYLSGDDDWRKLVQRTNNPKVSFMAAGPIPPSASELLSSERVPHLIRELSDHFDHVIFDSPPLLGLSDAVLIGRWVEGVIYVIESNRTSTRAAQAALERLKEAHIHIIGAVLTKYSAKQAGYGYGYSYDYRYGDDRKHEANGSVVRQLLKR
jgi:capsular exopolysaccharide synthesis family protein